jgi:DMSO/TMAO reductase YedYZ molybdopterin-dependent catalytic subunit
MTQDGSRAGGIRDKLIAIKQSWAQSRRLITGQPDAEHANRLPPGQRLVTNWPVLDLGVKPDIERSEWRLQVDGAVANPICWNWESYQTQPQVEDISDIHCVTQWSRFDNRWSGMATSHLSASSIRCPPPTLWCCTAPMAIPPT